MKYERIINHSEGAQCQQYQIMSKDSYIIHQKILKLSKSQIRFKTPIDKMECNGQNESERGGVPVTQCHGINYHFNISLRASLP